MVAIPESAHALLSSDALAHVVTLNPDGSPQATCVWVGLDEGDIVFGSLSPWQKIKNLRRDPRVALTIESAGIDPSGLREYLTVTGEATVTEGDGIKLVRLLAQTYIGPEANYPPESETRTGYVVRIKARKIGGIGPWGSAA
ncbi:PPOX class F420-dependent oxidoreductase [Actinacidiphila sp. ITFR-21]|uniref:PPOX class F420-dependent oxidoreductase n=1 Tax=Actinacidiphila sp. ITFR-21 TaxID=3075199 RepID=UPI0028893AD5|nr:PPOX class F420-dependent oxidoreductase [Streptomyces sp. ITFR-21]WNI15598.1 PPOX class F420-dependent oxidoreductase [Streptomyces sp. ITFR-21]